MVSLSNHIEPFDKLRVSGFFSSLLEPLEFAARSERPGEVGWRRRRGGLNR